MGLELYYPDIAGQLAEASAPRRLSKQLYHGLVQQCAGSFDEITTLPKSLRSELTRAHDIFPEIAGADEDRDCRKLILRFPDGAVVETVLINGPRGTSTVCVSSQAGCGLKCSFCATGALGFTRNLTHTEIASQVFTAARLARESGRNVSGVVVMGMGEPFLNFENTIKAMRLLNDPEGFALGARKISISTAGIIRGIRAFTQIPEQFNLAISLHTPFDEQRRELMPVSARYTIRDLIEAAKHYAKASNRKVFFEYLLLRDVNVSSAHINALAALLSHPLFHVNLIAYNRAAGDFRGVGRAEAEAVAQAMEEAGLHVSIRRSVGGSIRAACGQLAPAARSAARDPKSRPLNNDDCRSQVRGVVFPPP